METLMVVPYSIDFLTAACTISDAGGSLAMIAVMVGQHMSHVPFRPPLEDRESLVLVDERSRTNDGPLQRAAGPVSLQ